MKLYIISGSETGRVVEMTGDRITIGREVDNDVVINTNGVSRHHCELNRVEDVWLIEDKNSMNGVYVNGTKIDGARELFENDIIGIHDNKIKFVKDVTEHRIVKALPDLDTIESKTGIVSDPPEPPAPKPGARFLPIVGIALIVLVGLFFVYSLFAGKAARDKRKQAMDAQVQVQKGDEEETLPEPEKIAEALEKPSVKKKTVDEEDVEDDGREQNETVVAPTPVQTEPPVYQQRTQTQAPQFAVIETEPAGVEVLFDKRSLGTSPLVLRHIEEGRHSIELRKAGYETYKLSIEDAREIQKTPYKMVLDSGVVLFETEPPGAWVWEGRRFLGVTPFMATDMKPGKHEFAFYGPACEPLKESVEISSAKGNKVSLTLKSNLGGLEVSTKPAGCKVYLNGALLGVTEKSAAEPFGYSQVLSADSLLAGQAFMKVEHPSGLSVSGNVILQKGSNTEQKIVMWVPDTRVKLKDGGAILGMLVEKNEHGDVVLELANDKFERILNPQIGAIEDLEADEIREIVKKSGRRPSFGRADDGQYGVEELLMKAKVPQLFNQTFKDKQLMITGDNFKIMKDGASIILFFGNNVKCSFAHGAPDSEYVELSLAAKAKRTIFVRGICEGVRNDIISFKNCTCD